MVGGRGDCERICVEAMVGPLRTGWIVRAAAKALWECKVGTAVLGLSCGAVHDGA